MYENNNVYYFCAVRQISKCFHRITGQRTLVGFSKHFILRIVILRAIKHRIQLNNAILL